MGFTIIWATVGVVPAYQMLKFDRSRFENQGYEAAVATEAYRPLIVREYRPRMLIDPTFTSNYDLQFRRLWSQALNELPNNNVKPRRR